MDASAEFCARADVEKVGRKMNYWCMTELHKGRDLDVREMLMYGVQAQMEWWTGLDWCEVIAAHCVIQVTVTRNK